MASLDKNFLLTESKTFCMLPWIHIHTSPAGKIFPCCISKGHPAGNPLAYTSEMSLREAFNSHDMKQLRVDMLNEVYNPMCIECHNHDKVYNNDGSFRIQNNQLYGKYFDNLVPNTREDGSLEEFKIRYFDVRFNNICNFKCRTCTSEYSSQWEREDLTHLGIRIQKPTEISNTITLLQEAIQHIPYMEVAYFAGGEPLITLEHYQLLEEMIRQNRTDIILRYSTNCSTLKFKDKDLLNLWKNFKAVQVMCSFDHFGQRAQYMRNGTIWPEIEENFLKIKELPYVEARISMVLSIFNYFTIPEFFTHLLLRKMLEPGDPNLIIYKMNFPAYLNVQALPIELKKKAREHILEFIPKISGQPWSLPEEQILEITDCISWAESHNTWDKHKDKFQNEVQRLDRIRQENFIETFPELESLMDGAPKQKPPVV